MAERRASATKRLVDEASRGDVGAVDDLMARNLPDLERFVRRHAGPLLVRRESCTDLVQSACREVLLDLGGQSWRGEDEFRAWLYTAAIRKMGSRARYWRQERRDAGRDQSAEPDVRGAPIAPASPSAEVQAFERIERLELILDSLPESQRDVFVLVRFAGLGYDEIAERLGISEANARKLYSRAVAEIMLEWESGD